MGGMPPPRGQYLPVPHLVLYFSLPFLFVFLLLFYVVSDLSGLVDLLMLVSPSGGEGRGLLPHTPVLPLPPPPLPPLPLPLPPLPLDPHIFRACCMWGARAWLLYGHPPDGAFIILLTMSHACSSAPPPPPAGGGAPSPLPFPVRLTLFVTPLLILLSVGGL